MPASNESLVRKDGFSNIISNVLFFNISKYFSGFFFIFDAWLIKSSIIPLSQPRKDNISFIFLFLSKTLVFEHAQKFSSVFGKFLTFCRYFLLQAIKFDKRFCFLAFPASALRIP